MVLEYHWGPRLVALKLLPTGPLLQAEFKKALNSLAIFLLEIYLKHVSIWDKNVNNISSS